MATHIVWPPEMWHPTWGDAPAESPHQAAIAEPKKRRRRAAPAAVMAPVGPGDEEPDEEQDDSEELNS